MKFISLALILLVSCSTAQQEQRKKSLHLTSSPNTKLYRRYHGLLSSHPGKSGLIPLISGEDALVARVIPLREAQRSIDLQYYIWKDDFAGRLIVKEILVAADQGVKIRLLLDNFFESRFRTSLKILDQHPSIEVKMVNPNSKFFNHRMHNKSFIIDNEVAIIGGRNIGDEYYGINKAYNFNDMDLFMIGSVVEEVSQQFDLYWNSERSFDLEEVSRQPIEDRDKIEFEQNLEKTEAEIMSTQFNNNLKTSDSAKKFLFPQSSFFYWSKPLVVFDPPEKLQRKHKKTLSSQLSLGMHSAKTEMIFISPYFIPGKQGMSELKLLREKGVRIVVLTNSLLSTDVLTVYGGYKSYRKDLLELGVELYELLPHGAKKKKQGNLGSSWAIGLHGKVMIIDRRNIFVGSMNLDPRSKNLNTELGVVANSKQLAQDTSELLLGQLAENSLRVGLLDGDLIWIEHSAQGEKIHHKEPGLTWWKSFRTWLSSLFVPESLL